MNSDEVGSGRVAFPELLVHFGLHAHMGFGFKLKIAPFLIRIEFARTAPVRCHAGGCDDLR